MELNRVSEKKMVQLFGFAMILEIREHITSIMEHYGNSWEIFSHALKVEYFLDDTNRVIKKLFLEWIERPNKNLQATELLKKFERQYSQLSKVEKLTLEPNKVELFLQAVDGELQGKLELLLEDKEEDEGLTTKDMRALVQDYLIEHGIAIRESTSYGARVDDDFGGSIEISEFWASTIFTMQKRKIPREALLRTRTIIRSATASLEEKTKETKDKDKSIAYKILSDIEAATNLKGVLKECILNAKVEFTLKEILGIAKKEFHDVIIDSIKQKRQLMGKAGMSHAINVRLYKDEEEVDNNYKQSNNEKNGYNQRVRFEDYSDKEMEASSHYSRKYWARATTEVLVKVGDIEEPIVALVDHGSEMYLMSKDLYKKRRWPIDMEHGWAI
uniref:Predicted protein n=1 Tax=Physcomitrium patens TaxID=3218 RepID=A9U488_PHYPA